MYVCLCHGISDSDIRRAAREGARTLDELSAVTGCATACGACGEIAQSLIAEVAVASDGVRAFPLPMLAA